MTVFTTVEGWHCSVETETEREGAWVAVETDTAVVVGGAEDAGADEGAAQVPSALLKLTLTHLGMFSTGFV